MFNSVCGTPTDFNQFLLSMTNKPVNIITNAIFDLEFEFGKVKIFDIEKLFDFLRSFLYDLQEKSTSKNFHEEAKPIIIRIGLIINLLKQELQLFKVDVTHNHEDWYKNGKIMYARAVFLTALDRLFVVLVTLNQLIK
jgi:hypothetical protein